MILLRNILDSYFHRQPTHFLQFEIAGLPFLLSVFEKKLFVVESCCSQYTLKTNLQANST